MQYNIHPIIVHFPIAFLALYTLIKVFPLSSWIPRIAWRDIELILLVVGIFGAFTASSTGELAEHLVRKNHQLVETHAFFASLSTWLYGLILANEILTVMNRSIIPKLSSPILTKISTLVERIFSNKTVSLTLACLGLVSLTITGLLGGTLVYGTTADPIAPFVLRILGISI